MLSSLILEEITQFESNHAALKSPHWKKTTLLLWWISSKRKLKNEALILPFVLHWFCCKLQQRQDLFVPNFYHFVLKWGTCMCIAVAVTPHVDKSLSHMHIRRVLVSPAQFSALCWQSPTTFWHPHCAVWDVLMTCWQQAVFLSLLMVEHVSLSIQICLTAD